MSRISENTHGNRLVIVERGSGSVYDICVQAEGAKKITSVVFTSQDPDAVIAAYGAVAKTLELLHNVGDQAPSTLTFDVTVDGELQGSGAIPVTPELEGDETE